nr:MULTISPECIES: DUF1328 domain-containing protein [Thioalkalivibrio]
MRTETSCWPRPAQKRGPCPRLQARVQPKKEWTMLGWALMFLIVGIVAGVLGLSGIAGAATNIAWILFVVGLILAVIFFITGRRPPL